VAGDSGMNYDIFFMQEAIKEAEKAAKKNEVPVGCVITKNNKIISRAHNLTKKENDSTAHAEIIAIRKAERKTGNYRLTNCDMYVTIEPCPMCAGALIWARINKVFYGACDKKAGACGSVVNIVNSNRFNHTAIVKSGLLQAKCTKIIKNFFKKKRK